MGLVRGGSKLGSQPGLWLVLLILYLQLPGKKVAKASILDFYSNKHLCQVALILCSMW